MLVKNENNEFVELKIYANEILSEGLGDETVTEEDAENALAELYLSYIKQQPNTFLVNKSENLASLTVESINKVSLWEELRKIFCQLVNTESTFSKIIDYVLEAIAHIIPLGVFVKSLVKVIIKTFLKWGIGRLCPV